MANTTILITVLALSSLFISSVSAAEKKSYIIYLGKHSHDLNDAALFKEEVTNDHCEFLGSFLGSKDKAKDSIFYSYTNHINGFAAKLSEDDIEDIAAHPDVVSVFPNLGYKLQTTHSWEFMGLESAGNVLPDSLWNQANLGEDIIIATIDSGVAPEAQSFADDGYGPIPARWKGFCQNQTDLSQNISDVHGHFSCNRKLIGARFFDQGYIQTYGGYLHRSPRDFVGHGTHTLSTAGGNMVQGASLRGFANGTIKGGAPRARVAAYKVCGPDMLFLSSCMDSDLLAAIDAAISDGVDVISISMGSTPRDFFSDPIAIGTFHAVSRGISVVVSAGNFGPDAATVVNQAPWQITVAASTLDREFAALLFLGNGKIITGQSIFFNTTQSTMYPLITAVDARNSWVEPQEALSCEPETLDWGKVSGKIVICVGTVDEGYKGWNIELHGGVGVVWINNKADGYNVLPSIHALPATHLTVADGDDLLTYVNSTASPVGYIGRPSTTFSRKPSPSMTHFSSKGPNTIVPEILKPDITAPGANILAAYSLDAAPLHVDNTVPEFNLMSGTSMSCPHVAGVSALLKKTHPEWSPAVIKSAIMTTAFQTDNTNQSIKNASLVADATPFDYGAGHVLPNRASDPGLVYDTSIEDYLQFFCALGYNTSSISRLYGQPYSCPNPVPKVTDLNYPSITVVNVSAPVTVSRTLKNVGTPGTYTVSVKPPAGVSVTVAPTQLTFAKVGDENKFTVTFAVNAGSDSEYKFGWMTWSDGKHNVKSPLVVKPL